MYPAGSSDRGLETERRPEGHRATDGAIAAEAGRSRRAGGPAEEAESTWARRNNPDEFRLVRVVLYPAGSSDRGLETERRPEGHRATDGAIAAEAGRSRRAGGPAEEAESTWARRNNPDEFRLVRVVLYPAGSSDRGLETERRPAGHRATDGAIAAEAGRSRRAGGPADEAESTWVSRTLDSRCPRRVPYAPRFGRGARVVESGRLEICCTACPYRGFESHPLRLTHASWER